MNTRAIHIIVKYFFPVAAGIETNIAETYSALVKKGWQVHIHTSTNTLTEVNVLPAYEKIRGIHVHRYPWKLWGFRPKLSNPVSLIAFHNCNLTPHIPLLCWIVIKRIFQIPTPIVVVTPHGGFTPEWRTFPAITGTMKYGIHRTLYAFLLNYAADKIRAVSEWEKSEMILYGINKNKITVISNGVENLAFEEITSKVSSTWKKKVLSFGSYLIQVGRIHPIKNFETTIQALAKLPNQINFVIAGPVGSAQYKRKLIELAKELGVEKRILFIGVVRGVEKFYLMKQAIAMVHMAMWESYCNVVHEGMSQGLVCIVANNTALPFLVKEGVNGFCVETYDVPTLVNRIQAVQNPKNAKQMSQIKQYNRRYVRSHSWDSVANRMHELYLTLIAN